MREFKQSRRDFLHLAGKGILGAAALATVPTGLSIAEEEPGTIYPWTYVQIDKDQLRELAYAHFYDYGGCGGGTFGAVMELMAEKVGAPFTYMHGKQFANAASGFGVGSMCGALVGACAFIGLFCDIEDSRAIRDELFAWYRTHEFPQYQPEFQLITTVSNSVECRDSVGTWMEASGFKKADPERKARCAAVTAEVAVKAIELLNIHFGYEAAPMVEEAAPAEAELAANEYIGVGVSEIGGEVKVKVTMDGDKIAKIEVLSHNETPGLSDPAFAQIPDAMVAANSADVDVVGGATRTSEALMAAVKDALSQVK